MIRPLFLLLLSLASLDIRAEITLQDGWIKQLPPSVPMRAGYLTITNTGTSADRLLSASSPAFRSVEIHESQMVDGMMTMKHMHEVRFDAGETLHFKPGGLHLMMMNPELPLELGDRIPLVIEFESGTRTFEMTVRN